VEHDFPNIGKRNNAFECPQNSRSTAKLKVILLAIEDITKRKTIEECDIDLAAIVIPLLRALSGKLPVETSSVGIKEQKPSMDIPKRNAR